MSWPLPLVGAQQPSAGDVMAFVRTTVALLVLAGLLSACTDYYPPDRPYDVQYCDSPPGQAYGGAPVALPHPMQCFECGACY
jgi:hypothetical protein